MFCFNCNPSEDDFLEELKKKSKMEETEVQTIEDEMVDSQNRELKVTKDLVHMLQKENETLRQKIHEISEEAQKMKHNLEESKDELRKTKQELDRVNKSEEKFQAKKVKSELKDAKEEVWRSQTKLFNDEACESAKGKVDKIIQEVEALETIRIKNFFPGRAPSNRLLHSLPIFSPVLRGAGASPRNPAD